MITSHPVTQNKLGLDHVSRKEYEKARNCFLNAVAAAPGESVYWLNLGKCYFEQMRLGGAEQCLRQAIFLDTDHAAAHYDLSLVLGLQGKWEEFFKEYEWRNEYFSDLKYYRELYTFGRKVFVCKNGTYRSFLMLPGVL